MKTTIVFIVLLVLVAISAVYLLGKRAGSANSSPSPLAQFSTAEPRATLKPEVLSAITSRIPKNAEKIDLQDVSNENAQYSAQVNRYYADNTFTLAALADLAPTEDNQSYVLWLTKGEGTQTTDRFKAGILQNLKGGFVLERAYNRDLREFDHVVISKQEPADTSIGKQMLVGNFTK